ncbi:MAG: hypothetical protein Q4F78_08575 [Bacillota bacterium]|nr:hypothetical protein [Bacillota bacterium]
MRKRLLAIIATVAMVVAMVPSMVFGDTYTNWDKNTSLPTNTGNYKLTTDVNVSSMTNIAAGKTVTLDLNGHTVKFSGSAYCLVNGKLIIEDSSASKTGTIANDSTTSANCVITVNGECTLNGGKILHSRPNSGNAVYVAKSGSIFTMNDGVVESKTGNYQGERGAISAQSGSTVVINGGKIIATTEETTEYGVRKGAAIECYGTVIITGGTIEASGIAFSFVMKGLTIDPAEGKDVNVTAGKRIVDLQAGQPDTVRIFGGNFDAPDFIDNDYGEDDDVAVLGGKFTNGNDTLDVSEVLWPEFSQDEEGNVCQVGRMVDFILLPVGAKSGDAFSDEDWYQTISMEADEDTLQDILKALMEDDDNPLEMPSNEGYKLTWSLGDWEYDDENDTYTFVGYADNGEVDLSDKVPFEDYDNYTLFAKWEKVETPAAPSAPTDAVDTGDDSNMAVPFAIAGLVLAAMAAVVATRRRTN